MRSRPCRMKNRNWTTCAFLPFRLHFSLLTRQPPALHQQDSCLAVFCGTVCAHRAQRSDRGEQYSGYADTLTFKERKHWIWRRHGYYPCCIGGGFGNAGLTTMDTGERQVRTHSEFVTLMEKVLKRLFHTRSYRHRETVARCQNKRKSSRDSKCCA